MTAGITGHQKLGDTHVVQWIEGSIEYAARRRAFTLGLTSLAVGADQLFAEVLRRCGILFDVVVPCEDYESTFDDVGKRNYLDLLTSAHSVIVLPFDTPSEDAFFEAGRRIVNDADFVVAVWDGLGSRGYGGTADIVGYARQLHKPVLHINPARRTIKQL